jgi:membrane protease YdiL (CAAX protease family)
MSTSPGSAVTAQPWTAREDRRALWLGCGTFVLAMIGWYVGSVVTGWGEAESRHAPESIWMYVRKATMIALAVLLPILGKTPRVSQFGWRMTPRWFAITVVAGLFIGWGNRGGYRPESVALIAGAAFHTFAVELYFRGYWIKLLECYTQRFWLPILISGALYGVYQITVFAIVQRPAWQIALLMLMFTALGIGFGYAQRKSGAVSVAILMHFIGVLSLKELL